MEINAALEAETETERNEQDTIPTMHAVAKKKTRVRLKSPRLQLQGTLQRMEKLAQSNTLKETKAVDLLMSMADLQKLLLQSDFEEKQSAMTDENERLTAQHEQDVSRITELETRARALKPEVITKIIDPDVSLRAERDTLKDAISFITSIHAGKDELAIKAINTLNPSVAEVICKMVGVDCKTWRGYAHSHPSDWSWKNTLDNALNHETDLCRFCYASLKGAGVKYTPLKPLGGDSIARGEY